MLRMEPTMLTKHIVEFYENQSWAKTGTIKLICVINGLKTAD